MSESHEPRFEPALALGGVAVFCSCGGLTGFADSWEGADEIAARHVEKATTTPERPSCLCDSPAFCRCDPQKYQTASGR